MNMYVCLISFLSYSLTQTKKINQTAHGGMCQYLYPQHLGFSFFFLVQTGVWTQDLTLARQALLQLNLSIWEAETGGSQVWGQPGLHNEFQASLGYIVRPCLKTTKWPGTVIHTYNPN
jgi:hypothetical protein